MAKSIPAIIPAPKAAQKIVFTTKSLIASPPNRHKTDMGD
jgi:hypothetical protein